ncbi:MAG: hypothetical protein WD512_16870, partial [Candidatus Paceibacterota bacterium]
KGIEDGIKKVDAVKIPITPKLTISDKIEGVIDVLSSIQGLVDSFGIEEQLDKQINKYDELIAKQQEVVSKTTAMAADGNAEQLALEEQRLAALQAQQEQAIRNKEKAAKREQAVNNALILSNNILAISKLFGSGNPVTALALLPLVIGALASGISLAKGLVPSLYDGTEDTGNGGKLDSKGGFAAVLHPNERVMTAKQNKRIKGALGKVSNEDLVKMIENSSSMSVNSKGLLIDTSSLNERMSLKTDIDELISVNKRMLRVMQNNGLNINIDENGFAMRTKKLIDRRNAIDQL